MFSYTVVEQNIVTVPDSYYIAHCISADYALGKGLARTLDQVFDLRSTLMQVGKHTYPDCIRIDRIFNLVTKKQFSDKPTYNTLAHSLYIMKRMIQEDDRIHKLAIPRLASGLDRLEWSKVSKLVQIMFSDVDIEILACHWD